MFCSLGSVKIPVEIPVSVESDTAVFAQQFHFNAENLCHNMQRFHAAVDIKLLSFLPKKLIRPRFIGTFDFQQKSPIGIALHQILQGGRAGTPAAMLWRNGQIIQHHHLGTVHGGGETQKPAIFKNAPDIRGAAPVFFQDDPKRLPLCPGKRLAVEYIKLQPV